MDIFRCPQGHGLRHVRDQILWQSTGAAVPDPPGPEPPIRGEYFYYFGQNNAVYEGQTLGDGSTPALDSDYFLGPITNLDNVDYCILQFAGTISDISDEEAVGQVTKILVAGVGLPHSGPRLKLNTELATLPFAGDDQDAPMDHLSPSVASNLGTPAHRAGAWAPYFGYTVGMYVNRLSSGFTNYLLDDALIGSYAIATGDRFNYSVPIGAISGGQLSISGYEKIYPMWALIGGQDSPQYTSVSIAGTIVASLFEYKYAD